jgi:sulfur dioxygenase
MIFEQLNPGACRTYLIACEKSREVAIVDPVLERADDYVRLLEKERWKLAYIIDTHTHADHISGGPALCDYTHAPYVMHTLARPHCSTHRVNEGDTLQFGTVSLKMLYTPGHTSDSLALLLPDRILTGDTLFIGEGGAGRTDLPGGDPGHHYDSLLRLKALPDELLVFPAHDYRNQKQSTLGSERRMNPRLQLRTREEYVNWLSNLSLAPADWMLKVLEVNYACSQDPGSAWIPVDVPACQVKSALSLGVDGQPVKTISVEEARSLLNSDATANLVLDVRNPDEYIGELGHISGSLLIPVAQLPHRLAELQNYRQRQVICFCKAGGRSHTAAGILMQAGFPSVVSVAGGMTRWNELKYPTTK